MDTNYWSYHTEGRRCFVLDEEGYTVCEILVPGNNDPVPVARQIVRDHNSMVDREKQKPST